MHFLKIEYKHIEVSYLNIHILTRGRINPSPNLGTSAPNLTILPFNYSLIEKLFIFSILYYLLVN